MNDLEIFRHEIDEVDKQLIDLIQKRFILAQKIWKYKKKHNMPALQPIRWKEVLESRKQYAEMLWIDQKAIEGIWNTIHIYSLEQEK